MSSNKKTGGSFNPAESPLLTISQMQNMIMFFKQVFEDSSLAWWIKLAGVGAAIEGVHVIWQLIRYLFRF